MMKLKEKNSIKTKASFKMGGRIHNEDYSLNCIQNKPNLNIHITKHMEFNNEQIQILGEISSDIILYSH